VLLRGMNAPLKRELQIIDSSTWFRRVAAVYALGGGVSGLIACIDVMGQLGVGVSLIAWILFVSIYALGIWLGIRLLERRPKSLLDFRHYLVLQVPILQTSVLSYFFASLVSATVIYRGAMDLDFGYAVGSGWIFRLFQAAPEFGIGVNLVPIVLWILTYWWIDKNEPELNNSDNATNAT
jgi:hypothetical protein